MRMIQIMILQSQTDSSSRIALCGMLGECDRIVKPNTVSVGKRQNKANVQRQPAHTHTHTRATGERKKHAKRNTCSIKRSNHSSVT